MATKRDYTIVDAHLHVFDLNLRDNLSNKNFSHGWPSKDDEAIFRNILLDEAQQEAAKCGVKNLVFVQCLQDCPEESWWVYACAQKYQSMKGIVGGLDLTKHDKLEAYIKVFQRDMIKPKFVGVRMILEPAEEAFFDR